MVHLLGSGSYPIIKKIYLYVLMENCLRQELLMVCLGDEGTLSIIYPVCADSLNISRGTQGATNSGYL